jgi:class 3 adenylate cyclase/tetratricopeptide (TPR) repeat protein
LPYDPRLMTCPVCDSPVPSGARFCPTCGAPQHGTRSEERRVVTVLFADVVGFTALAERMDPEQVKRLIDRSFERLVADVTAYGGTVDKILGDGIIALFGAPIAHEDDAERAVRAALAMQSTIADHATSAGTPLQMRIGVNTGEVLVGALRAGGEYTAMGDVMNTGSRLQSAAEPGQVLVGAATHALTETSISYEPGDEMSLRGRDQSMVAFVALAPSSTPGGHRHRTHVPLVGRDIEMGMLLGSIDLAITRGRATLIAVEGEGGVGKSRLIEEVLVHVGDSHGIKVIEGSCVPYGESNPWWPVASALIGYLDVDLAMSADEVRVLAKAWATRLTDRKPDAPEIKRLEDAFLQLLGYPSPLDRLEASRARSEIIWAVTVVLQARLRKGPFAVAITDLHWADGAVLELFEQVMTSVASLPFVLLTTSRSDDEMAWPPNGSYSSVRLRLEPLDAEASAELARSILGEDVADDTLQRLYERSGGNPLFLEELSTLLAEAGQPIGAELPESLRALVAARLDQLSGDQRNMIDNAAVLGTAGVWAQLQRFASEQGQRASESTLRELVAAGLMTIDGRRWGFRSESVRDVAYQTLTKAARAQRHAGVGTVMEEISGIDRAEDIAHHYATSAELVAEMGRIDGVPKDIADRAAKWLAEASWHAVDQMYSQSGVKLATRGLKLIGDSVDEPAASARRRLLLIRADGLTDQRQLARARADLTLAIEESQLVSDRATEADAHRLLGELDRVGGQMESSRQEFDRSVSLFREMGCEPELARSLRGRGFLEVFSGSPRDAEAYFAEADEIYLRHGDVGGHAWVEQNRAWVSFLSGDILDADERLHRAAEMMKDLGDDAGLGWAFGLLAWVRYYRGMRDEALTLAHHVLGESNERRDPWAIGMMEALLSNLSMWEGKSAEALQHAESARSSMRKLGDRYGEIQATAAGIRPLIASGRLSEARKLAEEMMSSAEAFGLDGFAAMSWAGAAVHAGMGDRAVTHATLAIEVSARRGGLGMFDAHVSRAIGQMLVGATDLAADDVATALDLHPASGFAHAAAALYAALTGRADEAIAHAAVVFDSDGSTYLDRTYAALAACASHVHRGDTPAAQRVLDSVCATVDQTEDVVAQAMLHTIGSRLSLTPPISVLLPASPSATDHSEAHLVAAPLGGWEFLIDRLVAITGHPSRSSSGSTAASSGSVGDVTSLV